MSRLTHALAIVSLGLGACTAGSVGADGEEPDDPGQPAGVAAGTATIVSVPPIDEIGGRPNGLSSWGDVDDPPEDCTAIVGSEPWITLFEATPAQACVIVAEDQNIQIWNKGRSSVTVAWIDGPRHLPSDSAFETGPAGSALLPGPNHIESTPYEMPLVWLLPAEASPSAEVPQGDNFFGPIEPGMTLRQATERLGLSIEIDRNLLPGPRCLAAVIVDDPYSPFFVVLAERDPSEAEILAIEDELDEHSCR